MKKLANHDIFTLTSMEWDMVYGICQKSPEIYPEILALYMLSKIENKSFNEIFEQFSVQDGPIDRFILFETDDLIERTVYQKEQAAETLLKEATKAANKKKKPKKKTTSKKKTPGKNQEHIWPVERVVDENTTVWVDSSDEVFDPERHAYSKPNKRPSVDSKGRFRKKRGTAKETPPPEPKKESEQLDIEDTTKPPQPENESESDGEAITLTFDDDEPGETENPIHNDNPLTSEQTDTVVYIDESEWSQTLTTLISNMEAINSEPALDEIAEHRFTQMLSQKELVFFKQKVKNKRSDLVNSSHQIS